MLNPETAFTESIWRGWLEQTGYNEETMPLEWCRTCLVSYSESNAGKSMRLYMEAWLDGYRAAMEGK